MKRCAKKTVGKDYSEIFDEVVGELSKTRVVITSRSETREAFARAIDALEKLARSADEIVSLLRPQR